MDKRRLKRDAAFYQIRESWRWGDWFCTPGGWIYAVQEESGPLIKIGYARMNLDARLRAVARSIQSSIIRIGAVYVTSFARKVEQHVHWQLRAQRIWQEWFYTYLSLHELQMYVVHGVHAVESGRQHLVAMDAFYADRSKKDICRIAGIVGMQVYPPQLRENTRSSLRRKAL